MSEHKELADFKERVVDAVREAKSKGYMLLAGRWGVMWHGGQWISPDKQCCPLGALLLKEQPEYLNEHGLSIPAKEYFEALFGVPEVFSFISGVDGHRLFNARDLNMYKLGQEMRELMKNG